MNPIIEISDYSYSIKNSEILRSISLIIDEGEYFSIIGPNGAGKTTLLKCLMRILYGGTGLIRVRGKSIDQYRQRELARIISYIPQGDGKIIPFTVEEFVMMGRYPYLSPFTSFRSEDRTAVQDALEITGTTGLKTRYMATLSGGERQTVAIAAALVQGAPIMLLDEPTTFLDPKHEAEILSIISKINRERGITIISVTHDINNAALYSDRVGILKNGRFVFTGVPSGMMNNDILYSVYDKSFSFIPHPATGFPIIIPEEIAE
jgi:iron complex transport system ATP-binding protein